MRRTILKKEVAAKLFPDSMSVESAMQLLRREIRQAPELGHKLFNGDKRPKHYFTNKQLNVLLDHFGITLEEFEQLK